MGYYIGCPTNKGKAEHIVKNLGGTIIPKPVVFEDIPEGKALICVVNNGAFEAAGYCYSSREFEEFSMPQDFRSKQYVLMDEDIAQKLSGFKK